MPVSIRENLDDTCRDCGKEMDDADEVAPLTDGHWSYGPEWLCGDCMDRIDSEVTA